MLNIDLTTNKNALDLKTTINIPNNNIPVKEISDDASDDINNNSSKDYNVGEEWCDRFQRAKQKITDRVKKNVVNTN